MMMKVATQWDTAQYLTTKADMAAYLSAVLEEDSPSLLNEALGDIARAKGMTQLANETGLTRDGLYKALSPNGNPSFSTVQKVVKALNMKLEVVSATD
jgi:probable addiction module antidote protein